MSSKGNAKNKPGNTKMDTYPESLVGTWPVIVLTVYAILMSVWCGWLCYVGCA